MQEITSRKNPALQHLKKLGTDRTYRDETGEFLCDGIKLYREAVQWGAEITQLVTCDRGFAESQTGSVLLVPEDVLRSVSPLRTPQPVLFACRKKEREPMEGASSVLILDGVQDPGNVGTIIRSASAFYTDQVILTGESADLYSPKTVRAAMGALFRQPVCSMELDELIAYVSTQGLVLLGAVLEEGGLTAGGALPERVAVAVGSEGRGLSRALLERCDSTVRIPMNPSCESLNVGVASAILLWELYCKRRG